MTLLASTAVAPSAAAANEPKQRFLLVGLYGSENPTRANFPFCTAVAANVTPVGWPPLSQAIAKVIEHQIPIFV
jgi:hypothetical protein